MIVVPAGSFTMGSLAIEKGRNADEAPQHSVAIAKPFAVSAAEVTFDEWDTCVAFGDCVAGITDARWGRGQRPVINVAWNEAQQYAAWLGKVTGKPYRLLTEAEYEYAARAGTQTAYPWGDDIGKGNADCASCGSQWGNSQTAPVRSFPANAFALYDMVGNVWEWVEDCHHSSYLGVPTDGSAWTAGTCGRRVVRGGSWSTDPPTLRSANRDGATADDRNHGLGFRVARTLAP
jgi:formylglycine-generating enzyme required for sulfatase activity